MEEFIYPLSENGMKFSYFEAAVLYHEGSEYEKKISVTRYEMLTPLMIDAAKREEDGVKQFGLRLIILNAAKQYDDFDVMAEMVQEVKSSLETGEGAEEGREALDTIVRSTSHFLSNMEHAVQLGMHAGIEMKKGSKELDDLAFMVDDGEFSHQQTPSGSSKDALCP